jgi:hypothetical protein
MRPDSNPRQLLPETRLDDRLEFVHEILKGHRDAAEQLQPNKQCTRSANGKGLKTQSRFILNWAFQNLVGVRAFELDQLFSQVYRLKAARINCLN